MSKPPDSLPDPDWELLHRQPEAFFQLGPEYDRRELKRAYTRWIRRFKPEQSPEEFQQIRSAYDRLEEALRFGKPPLSFPTWPAQEPKSSSSISPPSSASEQSSVLDDLEATIRSSTPSALCEHLEQRSPKSPQERTLLAVAKEESRPEDKTAFFDVLIEGLERTNGAPALADLLIQALREPMNTDQARHLPLRLLPLFGDSSTWDTNSYFAITAPLFESLVQQLPFYKFESLLSQCRNKIGPGGEQGYLALLVRLVRLGAFRASPRWMEHSLALLEDTYHQLPEPLQHELNRFDFLDEYRKRREEFVDGSAFRTQVDQTLQKIATGPEREAQAEFLNLQSNLLDHRDEVLSDNPPNGEDLSFVTSPLEWYGSELHSQRLHPPVQLGQEQAWQRLSELLFRIQKRTNFTVEDMGWTLSSLLWIAGKILLFGFLPLAIFIPLLVTMKAHKMTVFFAMFLGMINFAVATVRCSRNWRGRVDSKRSRFFTRRLYRKVWRREVADFLETTRVPLAFLMNGLSNVQDKSIYCAEPLKMELSEDPALRLYSLALEFAE